MSRRTARKHVFNIIFQLEFHSLDNIKENMDNYIEDLNNITDDELDFIKSEVNGIIENKEKIDDIISQSSKGWTVERIAKADIAVLRIAVYEILFKNDIPNKVSINEAVEIAKEFSSDKAPAFINGVLGKVAAKAEI